MNRDPFVVLRVESESEVSSLGAGVRVLLRARDGEGLLLLLGPATASPSTSGGLLRLVAASLSAERRALGAGGWLAALSRAEEIDENQDPHD